MRKERAAASWTNSRFLLSQLNSLQPLCHISRDNRERASCLGMTLLSPSFLQRSSPLLTLDMLQLTDCLQSHNEHKICSA